MGLSTAHTVYHVFNESSSEIQDEAHINPLQEGPFTFKGKIRKRERERETERARER